MTKETKTEAQADHPPTDTDEGWKPPRSRPRILFFGSLILIGALAILYAWGLPPFEAVATSLKIYEQGSLVLDVMAPDSKPMWRGVARAEVHRDRSDAERSKVIRGAIDDLIKRFPPKQKKS